MTYDGSAQTPCSATMTGAGGLNQSLTVTYTDNTDVGTATASASFAGDANHSASSDSKTFIIDKASSVTTVTCSTSEVYTGSAIEPCTVSVTGAGGLNLTPDPIYTDNIVVGTATASYTYAGDANHDGSNDSDTFEITTKNLTVTGIAADDKPYDGNTTATLTTNSAALVGVVPGDDVTLDDSGAVGTFASPNVGTWTVTISGLALTDADSNNYTLTQPTTTASITGASLTVDGITADDKLYDGNTSATLNTTGAVLVGVVPGDDVTLDDSGAVGTFADPNVGSWTVTISGLTLTGTDAGKYGLTQPTTTANITTKPITVTANSGQSKVYGTVDPVFTYTHDPLVGTDSFSGALSRVAGENVGAYAITQGNLSAGDNYSITFVPTNFSIIKANTSISLTSSLNPAVVGTSVTFTVTVTPTAATGTVQFYADNLALGSAVTLSSGTVTISTTTLSAGTHAITATYSGNSNFNTNTSASLEQTVAAAADDTRKTYLPVVLR
ncbi:MAG: YDG domain-containing protein [Anaerolineae bacterium]